MSDQIYRVMSPGSSMTVEELANRLHIKWREANHIARATPGVEVAGSGPEALVLLRRVPTARANTPTPQQRALHILDQISQHLHTISQHTSGEVLHTVDFVRGIPLVDQLAGFAAALDQRVYEYKQLDEMFMEKKQGTYMVIHKDPEPVEEEEPIEEEEEELDTLTRLDDDEEEDTVRDPF